MYGRYAALGKAATMSNAGLCRMHLGLEPVRLQFCGYGPDSHTASSDVLDEPIVLMSTTDVPMRNSVGMKPIRTRSPTSPSY